MEKKLIILLFSFIITSFSCFAQDYEAIGDAAIKKGDYKTAVENFEAQLSYLKYKKVDQNSKEFLLLEKKSSKAQECRTLRTQAANIVKKLNVDYYAVLSSKPKSKGDEQIVNWNANIKQLTTIYNSILQRFPNDGSTKSLLASVSKYKPKIDQAYFDAYTMPEKWTVVQAVGTSEAYQAFLDEYPEGRFADKAYQAIHKQEDDSKWTLAVKGNSKESYTTYLQTMPRGVYVAEAVTKISQIDEDESYWSAAVEANSVAGYNAYLNNTPNGFNKLAATANLKVLSAKHDLDNGRPYSCMSNLNSFRSLTEDPVSLLLEKNKRVYYIVSEDVDYKAWCSSKSYEKAKIYVDSHPNGGHYSEVANAYARILVDSWDFLSPGTTSEQISYISSLAQDQTTISYVLSKIMDVNKIAKKMQSSGTRYSEYSGESMFRGYDKRLEPKAVKIYFDRKPKEMPSAEIWVDGARAGGDYAEVSLAPGYHTVVLKGWAYTNYKKYQLNKDIPTDVKQYVILVSNDGRLNTFYFKCPGAASFRAKKGLSITGYTVAVAAGIAAGIAGGLAGK